MIEASWREYSRLVLAPGWVRAGPVEQARLAYYAGAVAVLNGLVTRLAAAGDDAAAGMRVLDDVLAEVEAYAASLSVPDRA